MDRTSIANVSTAAKLCREVAHFNHTNLLAVFFAKQRHSARFLRFIQTHLLCYNIQAFLNLLIDQLLNLLNLFCCHGREMSKVEAQPVRSDQRTGLLNVFAQHGAKRLLQQMRRAVVLLCGTAALRIYAQGHILSCGQHAGNHLPYMADLAALQMNSILHPEGAVRTHDHTVVAALSSHSTIKRSLTGDHSACLSIRQSFHDLCIRGQYRDPGIMCQAVISHKCGRNLSRDRLVDRHIGPHVVGGLAGCTCFFTLLLHGSLESGLVHRHVLLLQDLNGQIQREPIGIIEFKCIFSGKYGLPFGSHIRFHIRKDRKTLIDGFVKLLLLLGKNLKDHRFLLFQLRITVLGKSNHRFRQFRHESAFNAKQSPVSRRTAQKTAQHVSASFVGRHNAVGYHKGAGLHMVCNNTKGDICPGISKILRVGQGAHLIQKRLVGIHRKQGIHVLNNNCQTLQSHTGINILMGKLGIIPLAVTLKLGEYVVPYLNVAVALTAYSTIRLTAAVLLTAVIIDLGTGAAGTCSMLPEVVFLAKAEDPFRRNADLLVPDIKSLIVIQINRRIETIRIQPHHLGQKLPGPMDGIRLKIISE